MILLSELTMDIMKVRLLSLKILELFEQPLMELTVEEKEVRMLICMSQPNLKS